MKYKGIVIVQDIDKQGEVIDVAGCNIDALVNSVVMSHVDFREGDGTRPVGRIVDVKKGEDEQGRPCVFIEADLPGIDLEDVGVGVYGIVVARDGENRLSETLIKGLGLTTKPAHQLYRLKRLP